MMTYEFGGSLYCNAAEMYRDMAGTWLSANGLNGRDTQLEFLATNTDEALARELMTEWHPDDGEYSLSELTDAFAAVRAELTAPAADKE
nr:hypothetical protein [uncultured Rhodopila sp.]